MISCRAVAAEYNILYTGQTGQCFHIRVVWLQRHRIGKEEQIIDLSVHNTRTHLLVTSQRTGFQNRKIPFNIGMFLFQCFKNQRTGCETDVAIFSLHAVKNVTTAEGGAICLNLPMPFDNAGLYKELRMMSLNCQTKDAFSKSKAGGWRYDIVGLGMKINMADVNAAIGLAQIREYPKLLEERKRVFNTYTQAFENCNWAIVPPSIEGDKESSYHIYALRIKDFTEEQRDRMIDEIAKSEVAVNVHFIPMPMLSFFNSLGYDIKDYPQAYENFKGEISLPIYPQLDEEKLAFIIDTVKAAYRKVAGDKAVE